MLRFLYQVRTYRSATVGQVIALRTTVADPQLLDQEARPERSESVWRDDSLRVRVQPPTGRGPRGHQYRIYYPAHGGTATGSVRRDTIEDAVEAAQAICERLRRAAVALGRGERPPETSALRIIDLYCTAEGHRHPVSEQYLRGLRYECNRRVVPAWKHLSCGDLHQHQPWAAILATWRPKLAPATLVQLYKVLSGLQTAAHDGGFLPRTVRPLELVPAPRRTTSEHGTYVPESERPPTDAVLALVATCRRMFPDAYAAPLLVAGFAGLRRGESLAVHGGSFGPSGKLMVEAQVMASSQLRRGDFGLELLLPKDDKVRAAGMPSVYRAMLEECAPSRPNGRPLFGHADLTERHDQAVRRARRDWKDRTGGGWIAPGWYARAVFGRVAAATPEWRPSWKMHALRHHFANENLRRGMPIHRISYLLGHSSIRVTEQTYVDRSDGAHAQLDELWD